MYSDIGRNDFTTASLWNLGIGGDEFTCSTSFCQSHDDIGLLLEHIGDFGLLALNNKSDLVFDSLAVCRQVVQTNNGSGGSDSVVRELKVG